MNLNIKKQLNIKILIFATILIVLVVVGFFGYTQARNFLSKRDKLVLVLDKNTDVYNATTGPSKELLLSLKSLLDFSNADDTKIQENISLLEKKLPSFKDLSDSIEKSTSDLDKGETGDTQVLYTTFNEGLATKKATIDILGNFINYEICLVKNASTQYKNISDFSDNLTKFSQSDENVPAKDKANFVGIANQKINENIALTNKISECFQDDKYARFLTNEMKQDLSKDIELYNQYTSATKAISDGLIKGDSQALQNGTNILLTLKDKNPIFYNSDGFKKAIQEPKKLLQDQATILETQEQKIKNQTNSLKSKYFLD
jgi:uncharacterized protein YifN (PemK superfamily)